MERKIGEIFKYNGEWYQCIRSILTCSSCEIPRPCTKIRELGYCSPNMRNDKEQVVFKKLEKVGKPYRYQGMGIIMVQEYILANANYIWEYSQDVVVMDCQNGKVAIEIKQNKEDIEEKIQHYDCFFDKKKSNLKPFNLEAAKQGKPVCTRDGRKARIICFDAKGDKPITALIETGVAETPNNYPIDGKAISTKETPCDLMMLKEKKEGWVNVYNNPDTHVIYTSSDVFESKEIAEEQGTSRNRIAICKISWEE